MNKKFFAVIMSAWCFLLIYTPILMAESSKQYDIVLLNGYVMDPESGLEGVYNLGIEGNRISAISTEQLEGREVVDVRNLVVAPGFIDIISHGQKYNSKHSIHDGVTTALDLEGGVYPVGAWYDSREGKALTHFGVVVSHRAVRLQVMDLDKVRDLIELKPLTVKRFMKNANMFKNWKSMKAGDDDVGNMEKRMQQGLDEGGLGLGFGWAYTPGATEREYERLFNLAKKNGVLVTMHIKEGTLEDGSWIDEYDSLMDTLKIAMKTRVKTHIAHITSVGNQNTPRMIAKVVELKNQGYEAYASVYPYTAWSSYIGESFFDKGWQDVLGIGYGNIEWVATGERLNEETFHHFRKTDPGGLIVAHDAIRPAWIEQALKYPESIVISDGLEISEYGHPRGAGTYGRLLGKYVRKDKILTLMQALHKITLAPARLLEDSVNQMKQKGRIKVGADADITIFDAQKVTDLATFKKPDLYSKGFVHVLVNGTFVLRHAQLLPNVFPGQAIRR